MKRIITIAITIVILTAAGIFIAFNVRSEQAFDLNDPTTWYAPSVKNEVALKDAEKITVGMSFESIVSLIGRPLRDEGSGGWIMVWQLENGDDLKIAFRQKSGTQILGDLIAFDILKDGKINEVGDLVKAISETDKYNSPFENLPAYTYGGFMVRLTQGKKPSSSPKRTFDFSYGMQNITAFDELYPINKLTVINNDCIFAEYKLDNNGMLLHAFVVFDRYVGQRDNGEEFELWQHYGEVYFAYPELNSKEISAYKGNTVKKENLPFLIDHRYNARFINANGADSWRSEETLILKDGYAIIDYAVDSPDGDMITVTDITFIPYGEKCDKYPYNSLISNAYVPDFNG